jgi:hypothetical protein
MSRQEEDCKDALAGLRIEGVPTFNLNLIEFLDKLGEGMWIKKNF